MYEDNKSLRFLRKLYEVLTGITIIVNIIMSGIMGFMNYFAIVVWIYGGLSYLGYIKKVASKEEGRIVYTTSIPIIQIVVVRVVQFLLGKFLNVGMQTEVLFPFFICCFLDIVLIIFGVMDTGSYYYESVIEQDVEDHTVVTVENKEK